jgi:hypothetical protein
MLTDKYHPITLNYQWGQISTDLNSKTDPLLASFRLYLCILATAPFVNSIPLLPDLLNISALVRGEFQQVHCSNQFLHIQN